MTAFSVRRTAHLARWNLALLTRNKLTLAYATVLPLLPLLLLLVGDRGSETVGANAVGTLFLIAGLFPVYYNVLAQFVTRRDELVLKRLRTGEARDEELLVSIAVPGAACALAVCVVAVPIAAALGQPLPENPLAYAVAAVAIVVLFTALAFWTAAWTRNAEAAQLTSLPIILLASLGTLVPSLDGASDVVRNLVEATPGAAMTELVRVAWFGLDGELLQPLVVIAAWTVVAVSLARKAIRWEPRS